MTPNDYRSLLRWCCYMIAGSTVTAVLVVLDWVPYVALAIIALACAGGVAYALRDPELDVPIGRVDVFEENENGVYTRTVLNERGVEYVELLEPWQQEWRCRLHREDAA